MGPEKTGMSNEPSWETSAAPPQKKILSVLGEELVGPCMEGHLLDPKFALGLDKNPGNGEAVRLQI